MKLQSAQRTQLQSLGRTDSSLNSQTGKAQNIATATQGITSGLNQVAQAAMQIDDMRTDRQSQQADLFMQKTDSEFWDQWGGKEFFDVSELPEDMVTEGMQVKGRIASAEVLPGMYEKHIKDNLPLASKIIERQTARDSWYTSAQETSLARQTKIQTTANANIEAQIFSDQKINYINAIQNRRPDIALQIANNMNGSPTETAEFKRVARETAETIVYEDVLIREDMGGIDRSIEFLEQEHEDYQSENGQMDDTLRLAWLSKLRNKKFSINQRNKSTKKANYELLRREITITNENANKGAETDPIVFADLYKRVQQANLESDEFNAELADLRLSAVYSGLVNEQNKMNREERNDFISLVENGTGVSDFEKKKIVAKLQSASDSQMGAENEDMLRSAVDSGAVDSLTPINLENGTPQNIAAQIKVRKKQHDTLEAQYGVSQGYLTRDEVKKLSSQFNTKSPKEQLSFLKATSFELGKDAINVYSQMQVEGAGSLAIAGNVALYGIESDAETILKGAEFKRESGEDFSGIKSIVEVKLMKDLASAYWNNGQYNDNIKDAVLDSYIGLVLTSGGSPKDLTSIENPWIDDSLYEKAVKAVTGGMLEFNDTVLPAPVYGMKQEAFDTWIKTMSPKEVDSFGGVGLEGSKEFLRRLRDDEFFLEEYSRQGSYAVRFDDGQYMKNTKGDILILKYKSDFDRDPEKPSFFDDFNESASGRIRN